jgi:hypothetical protein
VKARAWVESDDVELADADEAVRYFDRRKESFLPNGVQAGTIVFGPIQGEFDDGPLRVEVDLEQNRTALLWLPDGSHGVELPAAGPISSGFDIVLEIPAELARVSVATARQAVEEYVKTGEKPTCVLWETA